MQDSLWLTAMEETIQPKHLMSTTPFGLDSITLKVGAHNSRQDGMCLMEAVAWWAKETHSDTPDCVSLLLANFGHKLNDTFPDDRRQKLKGFIPWLPGTRHDGRDEARSWKILDWYTRTFVPAWLAAAGFVEGSEGLRGMSPVVSPTTFHQILRDMDLVQRHYDISDLRETVLHLIGIPEDDYRNEISLHNFIQDRVHPIMGNAGWWTLAYPFSVGINSYSVYPPLAWITKLQHHTLMTNVVEGLLYEALRGLPEDVWNKATRHVCEPVTEYLQGSLMDLFGDLIRVRSN